MEQTGVGAMQSVSAAHWRHIVPTQTGPAALPTQCALVWHCTHIMVARLHARLPPGAAAQSASDMQRSWQVLLPIPAIQTLGAMQVVGSVVKHERQAPAALSQNNRGGICMLFAQSAFVRQDTQRGGTEVVSQMFAPVAAQLVSPHGVRTPASLDVPPSLPADPAVPPVPLAPAVPPVPPLPAKVPPVPPVTDVPPLPALPPVPVVVLSSPPQAAAKTAPDASVNKSQLSRYLVMTPP
jgi:hypothetical protein